MRAGARHGLTLDPARYEEGRQAALAALERHPDFEHDDEIWFTFTERIVRGMGGTPPASYDCAVEITRGWELHENFELYDDVIPVLDVLRRAGLKIGLVSNSARDVHAFARHHANAKRKNGQFSALVFRPSSRLTLWRKGNPVHPDGNS